MSLRPESCIRRNSERQDISEKAKGKLFIITSHVLSELDELVTHVMFMQDGKVNFHRSISDLREKTENKIIKAVASIMLNNRL